MKELDSFEYNVAELLGRSFGSSWGLTKTSSRPKQQGYEAVYRADSENGRTIAIKRCANARKAAIEFQALVSLSQATKDIVFPLFLNLEHSFYAMSWTGAPTLKSCMLQPQRLLMIKAAGRWLRRLHGSTRGWRPRLDPELEAKILLKPVGEVGSRLVDSLEHRRRQLGCRRSNHSLLHTDFHISNIFMMEDIPVPFDPSFHRRGMPVFDIASFLALAGVYRSHAEFLHNAWPDMFDEDRRAFLEGYGYISRRQRRFLEFAFDLKIARMWNGAALQSSRTPLQDAEMSFLHSLLKSRHVI